MHEAIMVSINEWSDHLIMEIPLILTSRNTKSNHETDYVYKCWSIEYDYPNCSEGKNNNFYSSYCNLKTLSFVKMYRDTLYITSETFHEYHCDK